MTRRVLLVVGGWPYVACAVCLVCLACGSDHELRVLAASADAQEVVGGPDTAGLDTAGIDTAGIDTAGIDTAGIDTAGLDTAGIDTAGLDTAGLDTAGIDTAGPPVGVDTAQLDTAQLDTVGPVDGDADTPVDAGSGDAGSGDTGADVLLGACDATTVLTCGQSAEVALGPAGSSFACGLVPAPLGSAGTTLAVVAPAEGTATVRLADDSTLYGSAQLHRLLGCDPGGCVPVAAETRLSSGDSLLAVVDDWLGAKGTVNITVTCCAPACEGKACGPDGCGGTCGECAGTCDGGACIPCAACACVPACGGKTCGPDGCGGTCGQCATGACLWSGTCVAPGVGGERCSDAVAVTVVPWEGVYDVGATDDVTNSPDPSAASAALEGCARTTPGGRDRVFRVVPPASGALEIWLEGATDAPCGPSGGAPCPPAVVHVSSSCPLTGCLASGDFLSPAAPRLRVAAAQGKPLFVVVDGYDGDEVGSFHVRMDWAP